MRPNVGDRIVTHGRTVGDAERTGEVIEVRGSDEHALLVVRYDDGHQVILSPGSDTQILHSD